MGIGLDVIKETKINIIKKMNDHLTRPVYEFVEDMKAFLVVAVAVDAVISTSFKFSFCGSLLLPDEMGERCRCEATTAIILEPTIDDRRTSPFDRRETLELPTRPTFGEETSDLLIVSHEHSRARTWGRER